MLKPRPVHVPSLPSNRRVILDGPMPIWLFAALARGLCAQATLATYEPRTNLSITFWTPSVRPI